VKVLAPDGSVVSTSGLVSAADGDQGAVLPSDGTYTVLVDGWQTAVGRASLDVSSEEEIPGIYSTDQSSDDGTDEVNPSPVAPQPVSPLGPAPPGTYTTELWDAESTEISGGLRVVNSTQPGTAAVTGAALAENAGGAPLVGATVTLTDASQTATSTTTNAQGGFAFIDMPAGTYTLEISDPPLGLYRLINDTYEADTTSQLTAFITDQPQTYDRSQQPDDSAEALPQTPRAYPSFSRIPPTINVLDVKPNADCAPTIPDSSAHVRSYNWKFYVLNVAENEVAVEHYNQDAFRAFALTVSNYAWYYKMYPKSYIPASADVDNSINFQCFRPARISDKRWAGWINEALRHRIVDPSTRPPVIYPTQYKAGPSSNLTCANSHPGMTNQLSQNGLKFYSEHCTYGSWEDLIGVYYPPSQVSLISVPVRPTTSVVSISGGVRLAFQSRVRTVSASYGVAWGFIVSRKVGTGAWRTIAVTRWDEATRSIQGSVVINTASCARYRVAAWNPRLWSDTAPQKSKWANVHGGTPVGPTGVTC
jgi:hypothetical protein